MDYFRNRITFFFWGKKEGKDFEHEKPENWKWGIFYFAKNDYRFIVPKRNNAMGYTLNFAHRTTYIVLILIIAIGILSRILNK